MEFRVTEMNASDEFKIRTQFSDFSFRVIDPIECIGVLRGGRLYQELKAIFAEIVGPTNSTNPISGHLEPGDRAVFIVGRNTPKRLTTSTINEIVLSEPSEQPLDDC